MKPKIIIDSVPLLSSLTRIGEYTYEIVKRIEKDESNEVSFFYGYHSKLLLYSSDKGNFNFLNLFYLKING